MSEQPDRVLRLLVVLDRTRLSRATLYRKVRAGTLACCRFGGQRDKVVSPIGGR